MKAKGERSKDKGVRLKDKGKRRKDIKVMSTVD
jgi:hypothetical protein